MHDIRWLRRDGSANGVWVSGQGSLLKWTVWADLISVLERSIGALDGGTPMSHVNFKKWQCRMSLSLIFLNQCHMLNLRYDYVPCHYMCSPHVACL